jgi:hypothetical protein
MKRRTVLWLSTQDYEYLSTVATNDEDSKNRSMHRLLRWLREHRISSFTDLTPNKTIVARASYIERRAKEAA